MSCVLSCSYRSLRARRHFDSFRLLRSFTYLFASCQGFRPRHFLCEKWTLFCRSIPSRLVIFGNLYIRSNYACYFTTFIIPLFHYLLDMFFSIWRLSIFTKRRLQVKYRDFRARICESFWFVQVKCSIWRKVSLGIEVFWICGTYGLDFARARCPSSRSNKKL